jgi:hypothetical protein
MIAVWSSLVNLPVAARFGHRSCNIYALVDPRKPSVWRYIGRSFDAGSRRFEHMYQSGLERRGATGKERWISDLSAARLLPTLVVLEDGISLRDARMREQLWIRQALRDGHPLTNAVRYFRGDRQGATFRGAARNKIKRKE